MNLAYITYNLVYSMEWEEGGLLSKLCLLPCFILSLMQYILAFIMKGVA